MFPRWESICTLYLLLDHFLAPRNFCFPGCTTVQEYKNSHFIWIYAIYTGGYQSHQETKKLCWNAFSSAKRELRNVQLLLPGNPWCWCFSVMQACSLLDLCVLFRSNHMFLWEGNSGSNNTSQGANVFSRTMFYFWGDCRTEQELWESSSAGFQSSRK